MPSSVISSYDFDPVTLSLKVVFLSGLVYEYQGVPESVYQIADLGVNEVIVTLGSKGSLIYTGGVFYEIPAYKPDQVVDATGCGDTYMAGYLYMRSKNFDCVEAGKFGAAMATLKIESSGPFKGSFREVKSRIAR